MMNAVVRPEIYERDRTAIRSEPFLQIRGTLAQDDGTLNVIAEEVRALRLRRVGGSTGRRVAAPSASPYIFLKRLRGNAPDPKSWG
jgi:hypothetical protein